MPSKIYLGQSNHIRSEVGSTFSIQGFDLNYAGVILGPSVKYRNGKIIFDPNESCNTKAIRNRTLSDGSKKKFGEIMIQHEVRSFDDSWCKWSLYICL